MSQKCFNDIIEIYQSSNKFSSALSYSSQVFLATSLSKVKEFGDLRPNILSEFLNDPVNCQLEGVLKASSHNNFDPKLKELALSILFFADYYFLDLIYYIEMLITSKSLSQREILYELLQKQSSNKSSNITSIFNKENLNNLLSLTHNKGSISKQFK